MNGHPAYPRETLRRAVLVGILLCGLVLPLLGGRTAPVSARITSASELIDAVNQLRGASGLEPYRVNQALMAAAQAHSEYQASTGSTTHTGEGGSTPKGRAAAAGYGGGGTFYLSENIASGRNLSAQGAVQIWTGDEPHLDTMLNPSSRDAGAGVAVAGDLVFYTLSAGYLAGEANAGGSESVDGSGSSTGASTSVPGATAPPAGPTPTFEMILQVQVATPRPDGSIIHVVEPGQTLYTIASAYQIRLADLLALNNMTEQSVIYPGEKLLIRVAGQTPPAGSVLTGTPAVSGTLTVTVPVTGTLGVEATATLRPTGTPTRLAPTRTATQEPAGSALAAEQNTPHTPVASPGPGLADTPADPGTDPLLVIIGVLVFVGTSLVVFGSVLKRAA